MKIFVKPAMAGAPKNVEMVDWLKYLIRKRRVWEYITKKTGGRNHEIWY